MYEFSIFLKWFGPIKGAVSRIIEGIKTGVLCGFIPAIEANLYLEREKEGTFLIRYSKTHPGSFAVTFVDSSHKVKHCLLYSVAPYGLSLRNPPTIFMSIREFTEGHTSKLKIPYGNDYTLSRKLSFPYRGTLPSNIDDNNNNNPINLPTNFGLDNQCVVCMDAPLQTVFLECGHLACCTNCSEKLKLCPICRNTITRVVPIYRP